MRGRWIKDKRWRKIIGKRSKTWTKKLIVYASKDQSATNMISQFLQKFANHCLKICLPPKTNTKHFEYFIWMELRLTLRVNNSQWEISPKKILIPEMHDFHIRVNVVKSQSAWESAQWNLNQILSDSESFSKTKLLNLIFQIFSEIFQYQIRYGLHPFIFFF